MKIILDTHTLVWWLRNDPKLSDKARSGIADSKTQVFVSAVTAWEMATKARLGKWREAEPLVSDFAAILKANMFTELPVTITHSLLAGGFTAKHRDPFDRMLAAQSQIEGFPLVTSD
ncbi:MAG: type II toxin-antitoxin system VapC family toxin [Hyphomicrobiaceae bacterium]|nr:type II toxin-antitoxin system VapC family toxin [Hyphomicrobiaceae bacterium]